MSGLLHNPLRPQAGLAGKSGSLIKPERVKSRSWKKQKPVLKGLIPGFLYISFDFLDVGLSFVELNNSLFVLKAHIYFLYALQTLIAFLTLITQCPQDMPSTFMVS